MRERVGRKGIGIIGCGGFGEFIRAAWDAMDTVHVVAVCDSDPARAPGGVEFYTDARSMLADPRVEIVSVATPPGSHKDLAVMAMEAGKHALVEKPLALTERDALRVKKAAERTGRAAAVNFVLRYNPIVETLRELVAAGVLGKPRRIDLRNYAMRDQVPEGHWFWDPKVSGRILLEHGVHFFDLAVWALRSRARGAFSLGVETKPGMEDRVFAAVEYEDGVVGTFWHSFTRPKPLERTTFHVAFDLGEADVIGWIPLELRLWGWTNAQGRARLQGLPNLAELKTSSMAPTKTQSCDTVYEVDCEFEARVALGAPKLEVYSESLRAIMSDLVRAIDDPSHKMRVTLDDGIEAVRTAEMATRFAHPE